ncbi:MBL fold metallo-hydrolase [Pigmentiphaga aceris]|uniref:MBL fold metallo-hydrolase n=1 Tax=Pigmentiphaga aceris TaxID=1940612 RepID=A0A5C0AWG5_9BURK|nr:MBL fold metallo-hydrolase [Pigmentiphaga aceris]QEI05984.1 MBL fold metallo-hydrolase [Pigmentiphaga aceris]
MTYPVENQAPQVQSFFHEPTSSFSHIVSDPASGRAAIFEAVLDYDPVCGRTSRSFADQLVAAVLERALTVDWIIETHVHADHLSAAPYLRQRLGGQMAIGSRITRVQQIFGELFNAEDDFPRDGSQFDRLFDDGDTYKIGHLQARVMHTPGHTPACTTHLVGDAALVGDTLFMPDYGTARCDFPGGDARALYRSIQQILALPDETRLFLCHDYKTEGREGVCGQTTVGAQRAANIHVSGAADEESFVRMRQARDATLGQPRLILPSVQVNMRAGRMPPPESNGVRYLKVPIDVF